MQSLIEQAAELTDAQLGALAVFAGPSEPVERLFTVGVDEGTHTAIGHLPHRHGLLGRLGDEALPTRLAEIADHPGFTGIPPGHPDVRSFLGNEIRVRGVPYGTIYLANKRGEDAFTVHDEQVVSLLARHAAVAIENALAYESAARWIRQLDAVNELGDAMLQSLDLDSILELTCRRARDLLQAEQAVLYIPDDGCLRAAAAAGIEPMLLPEVALDVERSKIGAVFRRRRSERVDSLIDDPEADQSVARRLGARSLLAVPLLVRGEAIGVLGLANSRRPGGVFRNADLRCAETLADRAALALDVARRCAPGEGAAGVPRS